MFNQNMLCLPQDRGSSPMEPQQSRALSNEGWDTCVQKPFAIHVARKSSLQHGIFSAAKASMERPFQISPMRQVSSPGSSTISSPAKKKFLCTPAKKYHHFTSIYFYIPYNTQSTPIT